jgi:hypothetical protein
MSYVPRRTSTPIALCVSFRVAVIFDLHCLSAVVLICNSRFEHDGDVAATGSTAEAAWFQQSPRPPAPRWPTKAGRSTCWMRLRARTRRRIRIKSVVE